MDLTNLNQQLTGFLTDLDPHLSGSVRVFAPGDGSTYLVTGEVTTQEQYLSEKIQAFFSQLDISVIINISQKTGLQVLVESDTVVSNAKEIHSLDQISVVYSGLLEISKVVPRGLYKRLNFETIEKVRACVDVVGFISPIVLDSRYRVIDGDLRLEVAKRSGIHKIQVIVINASDARADFLRLVLNRSSEFQRWLYGEVDEYVDAHPQLQPLLEPLGFFGNKILPTTFFGNTVIDYRIDEYNDQMKAYNQDIGLAEWASMRRDEMKAEEELRQARARKKKPEGDGLFSLFNLIPEEEDFIPTHDAPQAVRDHVAGMREVAEVITDKYDEKRKAEKEALGQVWQTSRRTSKKKAADKRAEAEAIEFLTQDDEFENMSEAGTTDEVVDGVNVSDE